MSNDWRIDLDGTTLQGGSDPDVPGDACLLAPPEGTGVPDLRTQDVTYPQRDGVEHFSDYYLPRTLTALALIGGGCKCVSPREAAAALGQAWKRRCDDTELVLWTGCEPEEHESILPNGDFTDSLSGWQGTNCALTRSTTSFRSSPASMRAVASSASLIRMSYTGSCQGSRSYRSSVWIRTTGATRSFTTSMSFYNANGDLVGTVSHTETNFGPTFVALLGNSAFPSPPTAVTYVLEIVQTSTLGNSTNGQTYYVDDVEFVPQIGTKDREITGPFGVRGRPRVATMPWRKGRNRIADCTFRFDATDHRLFVLDAEGTPGSGEECNTISGAPSSIPTLYNSSVVSPLAAQHHWPMDFPRLGPVSTLGAFTGYFDVVDMIGTKGADLWDGYSVSSTGVLPQVVPPILYSLGLSAIQGPATFQPDVYPASYSSGMIGWWSYMPDDGSTPPAGVILRVGSSSVGKNNSGALDAVINFPGLVNKAMNPLVKSAFGFDDGLAGQSVFTMVTWTATKIDIYVGTDDPSGAVILAQTETITSIPPAGGVVQVFPIAAKISNVMQGWNSYGTSSTNTTNANTVRSAAVDHKDDSSLAVPNIGQICVPFQATIDNAGTIGDFYVMRENGDYVGIATDISGGSYIASSLDTETGTAKRFNDLVHATNDILGDPFMTIEPGETIHIFGGSVDVTVCFRPAVLST